MTSSIASSILRSLLPAAVELEESQPGASAALHPQEMRFLDASAPRRREQFAAGRACARRALGRLGVENFALLPGADRAPIWPRGVTGSITHVEDYCAAAAARQTDYASIGIDAEVAGRLSERARARVCTPRELEWLSRQLEESRSVLATVMFSAKEAVYKCQYQITGRWMAPASIEIELADGAFRARLAQLPDAPERSAPPIAGRFALCGRFVLCAALTGDDFRGHW